MQQVALITGAASSGAELIGRTAWWSSEPAPSGSSQRAMDGGVSAICPRVK